MAEVHDNETPPVRDDRHDALSVFLGEWEAVGTAYGSPDQSESDPKGSGQPWSSTLIGRWHTGAFFLVQEECAVVGGAPFDTLSVMGVDAKTGKYFARSFENHGFTRHYDVDVHGRVWTFTGDRERARVELSADGNTQTITWEWRPKERWLPLCDRAARRR